MVWRWCMQGPGLTVPPAPPDSQSPSWGKEGKEKVISACKHSTVSFHTPQKQSWWDFSLSIRYRKETNGPQKLELGKTTKLSCPFPCKHKFVPPGAFLSPFSRLDLNESISDGTFNTTLGNLSSLTDLVANNSHQLFSLTFIFCDFIPGPQLYCSKFSTHLSSRGLYPSCTRRHFYHFHRCHLPKVYIFSFCTFSCWVTLLSSPQQLPPYFLIHFHCGNSSPFFSGLGNPLCEWDLLVRPA